MTLQLRPAKTRLAVAYLATAAREHAGQPFPACAPGNTLSRLVTEFQNGVDGVNHDHPYSEMWYAVDRFYKREGLDELCNAEIDDRLAAALSVGFTTNSGTKVPAKHVANAVKTWRSNGWFRYEQQRSERRKYARTAAFVGLAIFGVPALDV